MTVINTFLMGLSVDVRNACWYIFNIGFLAVMSCFFPVYYCRKEKCSAREIVRFVVAALSAFLAVLVLAYWVKFLTGGLIGISGITCFLPYVFLSAFLASKLTTFGFWKSMRFISLSYIFGRSFTAFGCTIAGCCQGQVVLWGVYSAIVRDCVIPVQIFESCAILTLWAVLTGISSKRCSDQMASTMCIMLFGLINVVSRIFKVYQPTFIFGISIPSIFSFITMCVGLSMLYLLEKKKAAAADPRND